MLKASQYAHNTTPCRHWGDHNLMYDAEGSIDETGSPEVNLCMSDCDSDDLETELTKAQTMRDEGRRLRTFTRWPPSSYQVPARLAEAGFFYMGNLDRVKCAFCLGVLKRWQPEDIPFIEHQKHFPHCRFIKGDDVGNIPLGQTGIEQVLGVSQESTYSALGMKRERSEKSESTVCVNKYPQSRQHDIAAATGNSTGLGVSQLGQCQFQMSASTFQVQEPLKIPSHEQHVPSSSTYHHRDSSECFLVTYPASSREPEAKISTSNYTYEANRLATFLRWPADSPLQPENVARAGFYFVPTDAKPDRVKCGYCGGKLYGWQEGDDPMVEHSRCFPECPYVKMCGEEARLSARRLNTCSSSTTPKKVPGMLSSPSQNAQSTTASNNTVYHEHVTAKEPLVPSRHVDVPEYNLTSQDDVTVVMRSDSVLQVLAMGFPKERLERIVRQRTGDGRLSVEELVEAALQ